MSYLIDVVIGIIEKIIKIVWRILIGIKSEKQMASSKSVLNYSKRFYNTFEIPKQFHHRK